MSFLAKSGIVAWLGKPAGCHTVACPALLHGSVFRHCEKNYIVIRRSNPVKNSDLQNFFIIFSRLPRRFAPRNDDLVAMQQHRLVQGMTTKKPSHATTPLVTRNDH
ncbi:hypothetical protein H6P87_00966 [Rickettsia tillamookensis]|uniref:Secreted protein n=1 Tax=Rickettsia tillamookensis TaxID=2761623 RepID=A0A9E6MHX1_9RICK|nr:hypothetical protein H6P87_00966 [Rickettsia tillamookensis]